MCEKGEGFAVVVDLPVPGSWYAAQRYRVWGLGHMTEFVGVVRSVCPLMCDTRAA